MHLHKNVLQGGHLYIPRFCFKGGLYASLVIVFIFEGGLYVSSLQQCSFKRSTFHPNVIFNITIIILKKCICDPICPSKHTTCLRCTTTCTIYIKVRIIRFCKFQYIHKLSIPRTQKTKIQESKLSILTIHFLFYSFHMYLLCVNIPSSWGDNKSQVMKYFANTPPSLH